jgi:CCR4-NOT transcription complex subunit 1
MGCTVVLQRICTTFARSDELLERLFRVCCSYAVERSSTDPAAKPAEEEKAPEEGAEAQTPMNFAVVDSFTRLVYWMMKGLDKVQLLTRALSAITKELQQEAKEKGMNFNQRPYFRILLNLLMEVNAPDPKFEQVNFQLLCAFCNTFLQVNPLRLPNFAFAWLELISNRMFMPKLLSRRGAPTARLMFQRLLVQLLYVLEPYLRKVQLTESTRLLYKGTMRMLLVLLHDFPEFLCDYHFSFCDIVPIPCVQIRNLILSAFPRDMRLPDPFEPNLKVDKLPEINQPPNILSDYQTTLLHQGLKADVDAYMRTRDKRLLETIKEKLRLPKAEREALQLETQYNVPLLNALLLYVGVSLPSKRPPGQGSFQNPVEIFMYLVQQFDYEGRYLFLSAIANHLRYPNTHTHLFSCIMLYLFDGTTDTVVREQITRVLLERLIVHRPHPWGLLITFIELIRNRRYEFWSHSFVTIAPEIEKLFHSVALTWNCGPGTAST